MQDKRRSELVGEFREMGEMNFPLRLLRAISLNVGLVKESRLNPRAYTVVCTLKILDRHLSRGLQFFDRCFVT